MAGFVQVRSEPEGGATFTVYLPASPAAGTGEVRSEIPNGTGQVILVVDDEALIRKSTCRLLENRGYATLGAGDGAEALDVYTEHAGEIAAVITDLKMPVMDGVDLARVLRRMEDGLRIMAVTALEEESKFEELRAIGVGSLLAKPYTAEQLLRSLHELLAA